MTNKDNAKSRFEKLGLSENLLKQLHRLGFKQPTPIQQKAIPAGIAGDDVIGIAQTGTGKTLAFSIPMIQKLASGERIGLVILPTRELALQVDEEVKKIGRYFGVKTVVLIGGTSINPQIQKLRRNPNVIIATPGRLIDHIQQKTVSLSNVGYLVLDEADRMLDMGFEPQIRKILAVIPRERQTMLFSATMPDKIANIANKYMKKPVRVEIAKSGSTAKTIEQEAYIVGNNDKLPLLDHLLKETEGPVLVFARTKHGAKRIARNLNQLKHRAAEIHSNRSLRQRQDALEGFKSGKFRVLVATDIASRGIDVSNIALVINYDLPDQLEDYVHRIGRTGRAGKAGKAISFVAPNQKNDLMKIERLIRMEVPTTKLPNILPVAISGPSPAPSEPHASHSGKSFGPRGRKQKWSTSGGRQRRGGATVQSLPDQYRAAPENRSESAGNRRRGRHSTPKVNSRRNRGRYR